MNRCKTCKWWKTKDDWDYEGVRFETHPVTFARMPGPPHAEECNHPKVVFYEKPAKDGACVVDGSQYKARLLTGPDFGCVNHEAESNGEAKV